MLRLSSSVSATIVATHLEQLYDETGKIVVAWRQQEEVAHDEPWA